MTIDEAIKHAEEVAEEKEKEAWEAQLQEEYKKIKSCKKCAEEHRQLAEWLKELKAHREAWMKVKLAIDHHTEIHSDGAFYIRNFDVKKIIAEYRPKEGDPKLEHQPCDDAVSRNEVIDTIFRECSGENLDIDFAKVLLLQRAIKALPPVTPQPCEDAISRQAVLDIVTEQERLASDRVRDTPSSLGNGLHNWVNPAYTRYSAQLSERSQFKKMIQSMSSVTTQPKMGYWEWVQYDGNPNIGNWHCSECHSIGRSYFDFCPFCGCKMQEMEGN